MYSCTIRNIAVYRGSTLPKKENIDKLYVKYCLGNAFPGKQEILFRHAPALYFQMR
jgi:hypothetical protein